MYSTVANVRMYVCMMGIIFVVGPLNRYYLGFFQNYGSARDSNMLFVAKQQMEVNI